LTHGLFNGAEPAVDIISHAMMSENLYEFGMLDEEAVVNDSYNLTRKPSYAILSLAGIPTQYLMNMTQAIFIFCELAPYI
jgi:hypothetical protein